MEHEVIEMKNGIVIGTTDPATLITRMILAAVNTVMPLFINYNEKEPGKTAFIIVLDMILNAPDNIAGVVEGDPSRKEKVREMFLRRFDDAWDDRQMALAEAIKEVEAREVEVPEGVLDVTGKIDNTIH